MNKAEIAKRLRDARGKMARAIVCKECGISLSTLSMYENGERVPRDEIKKKLAALYGKGVEELFY